MLKREIAEQASYIANLLRDFHGAAALRGDPAQTEVWLTDALDEAQELWEDNKPCEFERAHIADLVRAVLL